MKKLFAIGCAGLLILAAALIGVLMTKGPQWFEKGKSYVQGVMAEGLRIAAFETAWNPPPPEPASAWAPATVGEWKLKEAGTKPGWPELNVTRAGRRMIYAQGAQTIEIGVVPANDLEREALVKRIVVAVGGRIASTTDGFGEETGAGARIDGSQMTTTMGNRTLVEVNGTARTRVWWLKDWLFFFRSKGDPDPVGFAEEFLKAISAPEPPEPKPDAI